MPAAGVRASAGSRSPNPDASVRLRRLPGHPSSRIVFALASRTRCQMFKTLLVPLDGSALAEQSLGQAAAMARATGASIDLVTVHQPPAQDGYGEAPRDDRSWSDEHRYLETDGVGARRGRLDPRVALGAARRSRGDDLPPSRGHRSGSDRDHVPRPDRLQSHVVRQRGRWARAPRSRAGADPSSDHRRRSTGRRASACSTTCSFHSMVPLWRPRFFRRRSTSRGAAMHESPCSAWCN